ncbi:efflux RND transporter periplasmic adaptor subunit [Candidatus Parcubacteria bacterium]|nr:MAG: efflux RND transporter periplasmic adaptor subunit [Candidatus Parcubacteria bacterium]
MKFFKSKWLWIIIVILIIIAIVVFKTSSKQESNYVTAQATVEDIEQTVEVTGSVESADDIELTFSSMGTLSEVLVKVGDEVKAGDRLAALSAGNVASQVTNARAALDLARSDLDRLLAGASDQDLEVTKKEIASAQASYQSALDKLSNLEQTRDQEIVNLKDQGLNTLTNKYFVAQYSLDLVYDAIMDAEADGFLYVSDVKTLSNAKANYNTSLEMYSQAGVFINIAKETQAEADVLTALDYFQSTLQQISSTLTNTFDVMSVAVVNSEYTETVIATFKTNISTQSTAISTAMSTVQSEAGTLRSQSLYYQTQIINAKNDINSSLASLNLAEAKLALKNEDPRDFDIAAKQAQIRQAEATLSRYLSDFSDTIIKAPVDGIITQVNFAVGETSSASKPVISMIGLSSMQIDVDVPESDITKIKIGDEVAITLDAFSSDEKFVGTVTFVDPAATVIDGVTYYAVKVSFNQKDDRIKSGMTADLTINTEKKEGVLVIPSRAVIYREDKKYVQLLDSAGQLIEKEIETGLRGDGGTIEIVSGLSEGEEVVTYIKNGN